MEQKENIPDAIKFPELVIGLAGAIGTDMNAINEALAAALKDVGYVAVPLRVSAEIANEQTNVPMPTERNVATEMGHKMSHANEVCRKHGSADSLMVFAMRAIRRHRAAERSSMDEDKRHAGGSASVASDPAETVLPRTAYVIRQLKRPEEVALLRKVYGKQFILISAYASVENRRRILTNALKRSLPLNSTEPEISSEVDKLVYRDENEDSVDLGQNLRETFPLADVFIDGINKSAMSIMLSRFIQAFFGRADIAPTKGEYGMYAAKSASLRSSDLSRQVGVAIFTVDGELVTQGCNEVPKAFGGTYWDGEEPDYRDVKLGFDPNDVLKRELVRDLLERLSKGDWLSERANSFESPSTLVDALLTKSTSSRPLTGYGCLADAAVMDLTEYGRVVHAEMCAICDAARLGKAVKATVLYCTTFPCHNCTKHILAVGIQRVIFIEPYPKSKAKELHENEIEIEKPSDTRVSFQPFLGISPARYRDVFQKGKRKADGLAVQWIANEPRPMIDSPAPTYIDLESFELARFFGDVRVSPFPPLESEPGIATTGEG